MANKIKFQVDVETCGFDYGLSGPAFVRDGEIRKEIAALFNDTAPYDSKPRPKLENLKGGQPKPWDLMKLGDKNPVNGETVHTLWGAHHYEQEVKPDTRNLIEGEICWVMEHEGGKWEKFEVGEFMGALFFVGEEKHSLLPSIVYDFGYVEDKFSQRGQALPVLTQYNEFNDGEYYWVQLYNEGEWEIGKLNTVCGRGNYYFELIDSLTTAQLKGVHDFQLIKKPK